MKRLIGISIFALLIIGLQVVINCSSPLESADLGNPSPPPPGEVETLYVTDTIFLDDTLYVTDTIEVTDTLEIVDTLSFTDTLLVTDTLIQSDTIYVEVPGEDCEIYICSYISSYIKKIYWKFPDLNGNYRFKFTTDYGNKYNGDDDDDDNHYDCGNYCPLKKLKVRINDRVYDWYVGDSKTFTKELNVGPNTIVKVYPYAGKWCKHQIDICLKVTPL